MDIAITVSNSHQSLTQKSEALGPVLLDHADQRLARLVENAIKAFGPDHQEVVVKVKMEW